MIFILNRFSTDYISTDFEEIGFADRSTLFIYLVAVYSFKLIVSALQHAAMSRNEDFEIAITIKISKIEESVIACLGSRKAFIQLLMRRQNGWGRGFCIRALELDYVVLARDVKLSDAVTKHLSTLI